MRGVSVSLFAGLGEIFNSDGFAVFGSEGEQEAMDTQWEFQATANVNVNARFCRNFGN